MLPIGSGTHEKEMLRQLEKLRTKDICLLRRLETLLVKQGQAGGCGEVCTPDRSDGPALPAAMTVLRTDIRAVRCVF